MTITRTGKPGLIVIQHQPHRAFAHLRRELVRRLARHSPILSGVGAPDKPGAVQCQRAGPSGRQTWTTLRTSGLSIPMPNADVATTMSKQSFAHPSTIRLRSRARSITCEQRDPFVAALRRQPLMQHTGRFYFGGVQDRGRGARSITWSTAGSLWRLPPIVTNYDVMLVARRPCASTSSHSPSNRQLSPQDGARQVGKWRKAKRLGLPDWHREAGRGVPAASESRAGNCGPRFRRYELRR